MWYMDWNAGQPKSVADHFTRDFFYWRPDLLLVFDRVTTSQASYSIRNEWGVAAERACAASH